MDVATKFMVRIKPLLARSANGIEGAIAAAEIPLSILAADGVHRKDYGIDMHYRIVPGPSRPEIHRVFRHTVPPCLPIPPI
jgi:hypothetical protein